MGVTVRSQILEVYLLYRIFSLDNPEDRFHQVFTKDQLATEIKERYGFSWDNDFEVGMDMLKKKWGPGILQLPDDEYIWVFGKEQQCTANIHPATIETWRSFYEMNVWGKRSRGFLTLYVDARTVYERIYNHPYETALETHLKKRRESYVRRGDKETEIPF